MILFHVIQKLRPGIARSPAWFTPFRVMDLDGKVPLGIRVGEGLHQNIVDNAENCRGRSNPQRQSKYGDGRKSWRLAKVPQRVSDILPQRFHVRPQFRRRPL